MDDHLEIVWPSPPKASRPKLSSSSSKQKPVLLPLSIDHPSNRDALTPPETPIGQGGSVERSQPTELFHNYLRALYTFDPALDPTTESDAASITVPIKHGDLILVHSVHANGWADGTVLSTSNRGWIPTNYCEPYDHSYIRSLLNAMTQFWDLLEDSEEASFSTFVRQDYIRGLIAGVRYLLEHAGALHRESTLVRQHLGIRRMRKGLLADLSSMVQKAKELQEEAGQPYAGEVIHVVLDELVVKACKVVTRAVRFVDIWLQEAPNGKTSHNVILHPDGPTSSRSAGAAVSNTDAHHRSLLPPPLDSAKFFSNGDKSPDSELAPSANTSTIRRILSSAARNSLGVKSHHRLSLVRDDNRSGTSASERLSQAHDLCISHLGKFLGHHLQSRSLSELVVITRGLEASCKSLFAVMDQISPHESERTLSLQQARLVFEAVVEELVQSTREIIGCSESPDDEVVVNPGQISRLVTVGTRMIRAVGECVAHTRKLLEQTGNFQLQQPPIAPTILHTDSLNSWATTEGSSPNENPSPSKSGRRHSRRLSHKMLPSPPPSQYRLPGGIAMADFGMPSPAVTIANECPSASSFAGSFKSFPSPYSNRDGATPTVSSTQISESGPLRTVFPAKTEAVPTSRKDSVSTSVTDSTSTQASQFRGSECSMVSETSTRATTPEKANTERKEVDPRLLSSFASLSSMTSMATDASTEIDSALLQKSSAHELILNSQGQVVGGSLQALVEQLTLHDATPDAQFATGFYLTFRLFTTPRELAQTLIERFDCVGDSKTIGKPVRLRICQVFKGWLETYWNPEADKEALGDVRYFAMHKLKEHLPSAADRLLDLTKKVAAAYQSGSSIIPLVSGVGKTSTSFSVDISTSGTVPEPIISKAQLSSLRNGLDSSSKCSIIDFDPIELARQLTLLTSKFYCNIQPDELLALEWNKKNSFKAPNIRNVSRMNTDLAYIVGDTILSPTDVKKRAAVIKHWIKVAYSCLDLRNFESLMAIVASMDSSMVQRLKRTWEVVSKKTKARFEELKAVIDVSQNYASLRHQVDNADAPCLPFLGIYLQDMTFVDAGNLATRQIPGAMSGAGHATPVINFDKFARMARIVTQIQRFQIPYQFQAVPEMQAWLEAYLQRMREANAEIVGSFHRRSLFIEPRHEDGRPKTAESRRPSGAGLSDDDRPRTPKVTGDEKPDPVAKDASRMDLFWKHNGFGFKTVLGGRHDLPVHQEVDERNKEKS